MTFGRASSSGEKVLIFPLPGDYEKSEVIEKRRAKDKEEKSGQGGDGQPATRSESDSEGGDKPQSESEGRSQ